MTRLATHVGALLFAAILAILAGRLADVEPWLFPALAAGIWVVCSGVHRSVHALVLRRACRAARGIPARAPRALADAAALRAVVAGGAGFTVGHGNLAALEAAVLLGPTRAARPSDEATESEPAVLADVARSSPAARRALATGWERLVAAAVAADSAPLDPLHPIATEVLALLGERPRGVLDDIAPAARRARRRTAPRASRPEELLALRLLASGLDRAALAVVERAPPTDLSRRLRRLARCRVLLLDAAQGDVAPPAGRHAVADATELLLLAGRRLPDLIPGSAFLAAYPGGAAALERLVARTPLTVAELAHLAEDAPELERAVATVIARAVRGSVGATVTALRRGAFTVRADEALRSHLRGLALLEERRLSEATAEFEAALAQAPDFAQAAFALAATKLRHGHAAAGEAVLQGLVDIRSGSPEPLLYLARYLSLSGERERAAETYEGALGRFPDSLPLRVAFAQELVAWGRGDDALPHLAAARRCLPREPRLALLAGRTLATEGHLDEAAAALERAARGLRHGEQGEAWFWLMAVRRDQGDHRTAERLARRLARVLGAGQASLLDDVADYLEERHDYERAREATERARKLREEH